MTKYKILEILRENRGNFISGEVLGRKLEISRTAIWKGIRSLKDKGYNIIAITNRGYSLVEDDLSFEESLRQNLKSKELGSSIKYFESIDSTNAYLVKESQNLYHGALVVADEQTNGRAHKNKVFYSPKESGLYFSILLKKDILLDSVKLLNLGITLGIIKGIHKATGIKISSDWTNLLLNNKKIGGFLLEYKLEYDSENIDFLIVGIGINVNNSSFPKEIKSKISSLKIEGQESVNKEILLSNILEELEKIICKKRYIKNRLDLIEEYKDYFLLMNKEVKIFQNQRSVAGKIINIDEKGGLILLKSNKTKETFYTGRIIKV